MGKVPLQISFKSLVVPSRVPDMPDNDYLRAAMRKIDKHDAFPLAALAGMTELRSYLNAVETQAITRARDLGATAEDIADALGITRQGVYYKLKGLNGHKDAADQPSESQTEVDLRDSASVNVHSDSAGAHS
jgi:hypothetical protein